MTNEKKSLWEELKKRDANLAGLIEEAFQAFGKFERRTVKLLEKEQKEAA